MKKLTICLLLFTACFQLVRAQKNDVDSLQKAYQKNKQDTTRVQLLIEKSVSIYLTTNTDSGMLCLKQSLAISRKIHFISGEVASLSGIATYLNIMGDLPGSLRETFIALPMALQLKNERIIANCYNTLGLTYSTLKDYKKAQSYYLIALSHTTNGKLYDLSLVEYNNLARNYLDADRLDSALFYNNKAYALSRKEHDVKTVGYLIRNFGIIQFKRGNYKKAIDFYNNSLQAITGLNNHYLMSEDYRRAAEAYQVKGNTDSCIYFSKKALAEAKLDNNPDLVMRTTSLLTNVFKAKNDYKDAYDYQQIMLSAQDSLFSQQKTLQVQNLTFSEQQRQQEIQAAQVAYQDKVRFYTLIGVLGVVLLIVFILWFSNYSRKKANRLLHQQNQQIQTQHQALEKTLAELNTTQTQLVQREKMASLGELTAGIAHEIQNPLNFVNNFSEVNTELIDEMKLGIEKGDYAEVKIIADDIQANQQKISMHGKRADFIVKGMLQHSRTSTGEKQETNINILADEFLKLSYHGLRAKDKSFNAEMVTNFDERLPKMNIAQQDIGRVLLNLFNNAFYAVNEKKKTAGADYKPEVTVGTSAEKDNLIIKVKDNGNGIPDAIKDKIMQPFFTTKPTGEGTGLGLSLSYDIVVKGHGGSITVDTKEGEYTIFTIYLPLPQ